MARTVALADERGERLTLTPERRWRKRMIAGIADQIISPIAKATEAYTATDHA